MVEAIDISFDDDPPPKAAKVSRASPLSRTLPHSIEAEEHLLSCCLLEESSSDTLARCIDARISPTSFYVPAHGIIFEHLLALHAKKTPISLPVLAEDLKSTRQLDAVGGYAMLVRVSSAAPTSGEAEYFIGKVRTLALLREIIRSASSSIEDCYNFSGEIDEFAPGLLSKFKQVIDDAEPGFRSDTRPLTDFDLTPDNDPSILLGNRYLNRGDGAVLVGTSGIGKSSMSIQMATLWALGMPAFGIKPNGPLRSLIIQSEDSDGDIAEIWASLHHKLNLTPEQINLLRSRVIVVNDRTNRGRKFLSAARRAVEAHKPDLLWINPLQAFMDGDVTESKDLGAFLREGINGINTPPSMATILVHHTTKPSADAKEKLWHEVMYDMAGGAELINWARAIMSLRASAQDGEFNLVLAKRGRRAGVTVRVEDGLNTRDEVVTSIALKHSRGHIEKAPGRKAPLPIIFWEGREPDPKADNKENKITRELTFSEVRFGFPAKGQRPMGLKALFRLISGSVPIGNEVNFYNNVRKFEREGFVEAAPMEGGGQGYRMAV